MNPQHINLALTTPFENLLTIPQGVQLAHNMREGLEGITPQQAATILGAINGMIENAIKAGRIDGAFDAQRAAVICAIRA